MEGPDFIRAFFIFGRFKLLRMKYLTVLFVCLSTMVTAQLSPIGKWKTIDESTGKEKSVVEITERDGKYYGRIVKVLREPGTDQDPSCTKCPADDDRYEKKVVGLEIIRDLVKDGDDYSGGTVLDPEKGEVYKCKIWMEGKDLMVRGYWGVFYRTQTWKKIP